MEILEDFARRYLQVVMPANLVEDIPRTTKKYLHNLISRPRNLHKRLGLNCFAPTHTELTFISCSDCEVLTEHNLDLVFQRFLNMYIYVKKSFQRNIRKSEESHCEAIFFFSCLLACSNLA